MNNYSETKEGAKLDGPCWLFDELSGKWSHWGEFTFHVPRYAPPLNPFKFTHYHPDQPTAPTSIPSPVSSQEGRTGGLLAEMGEHYAQKQDRQDSEGAVFGRNGGVDCDTNEGPCACGAWHDRIKKCADELGGIVAAGMLGAKTPKGTFEAVIKKYFPTAELRPNQPAQEADMAAAAAKFVNDTFDAAVKNHRYSTSLQDRIIDIKTAFYFAFLAHLRHFPAPSPGASVQDNTETEKCSVCDGPEPCSHDFDKENRQLEEIGRIMGTTYHAAEKATAAIDENWKRCIRESGAKAAPTDTLSTILRYFPALVPEAAGEVRQAIAQAIGILESAEAISWSADHASNKAVVLAKLKAFLSKPAAPMLPGGTLVDGKDGVSLIAAERARQISKEGWDAGHDDEHDEGELARAAACYALPQEVRERKKPAHIVDALWPWHAEWWKPTPGDRIRELSKAGALIAAEIDRLNRAAMSAQADAGRDEK